MSAAPGTRVKRKDGDWIEIEQIDTKECYYFNKVSKETSWEVPAGLFKITGESDTPTENASEAPAEVTGVPSWLDSNTVPPQPPATEARAWKVPNVPQAVGVGVAESSPVIASTTMDTAAAGDNPFGDSSDDEGNPFDSDSAKLPVPQAPAAAGDNPFGDSSDDEGGNPFDSNSAKLPVPATQAQATSRPKLPGAPQAMMAPPPAKLAKDAKIALQALLLLGVPQSCAAVSLQNSENDPRKAMLSLSKELQSRPNKTDNQIWRQVLEAKVGSWIQDTSTGAPHTVYVTTIMLDVPRYASWQVCKRFNIFQKANGKIQKLLPFPLPCEFPSHGWFTRDDSARKADRQSGLDLWLKCLLSNGPLLLVPGIRDVLWDLLDIEENMAKAGAKAVAAPVQQAPQLAANGKSLRKPSIRT
jgi:hypothetical protein